MNGLQPRGGFAALDVEREMAVREFGPCPNCGRKQGQACHGNYFSCTPRYNAAAAAGLVPALRPIPTEVKAA